MAEYIYLKYSVRENYGSWSSVSESFPGKSLFAPTPVKSRSGYSSYSFSNNRISQAGSYITITNEGNFGTKVYSNFRNGDTFRGADVYRFLDSGTGNYGTVGIRRSVTSRSRGSFIEEVIAEDGTYPDDGYHSPTGYWYVKGELANTPPEIMVSNPPTGIYEEKPIFEYTVSDADGDTITVTEKIDGITIRSFITEGGTFTYAPGDLDWIKTRINTTVNCEVIADDGKGGITTESFPIMRKETAIDIRLKTPFVTDVAARRIMLNLDGAIPVTVNALIEVCNNAFDDNPTWENATTMVLQGFPYPFENKVKTADEWGISFKIRIERGDETGEVHLDGIGGAFD